MRRVTLAVFLIISACGGTTTDPGGSGGGNGGSGGNNGGGTCCLNGSFYQCNDQASFEKCAGFDVGSCMDACGLSDFMCRNTCFDRAASATHDPSSCQRDSSKDNTCGTGGGGGVCNTSRGVACTYSSQCSSNNCTDGYCRGNSAGDACTYSSQCNSNNCTDGCCRGNSKGSKCTYSSQCTDNNCTNGVCQ